MSENDVLQLEQNFIGFSNMYILLKPIKFLIYWFQYVQRILNGNPREYFEIVSDSKLAKN